MSASATLTRDEYHLRIRQNVDALNARMSLPAYFTSTNKRDRVLFYFMGRAAEIGEASFRIADLQTPLFVLARVLCEDFFTMYWVSLSEKNADEYQKAAISEMAKIIQKNLTNKRARIRHISSKKDVTAEFLPKLSLRIIKKKTIKEIAAASGLSKVYDIVYRYDSLEVHGNTFEVSEMKPQMDGIAVAASAVNALLRAILLVVDNKDRPLVADEILAALNMVHGDFTTPADAGTGHNASTALRAKTKSATQAS
jgi:hypothetical protein